MSRIKHELTRLTIALVVAALIFGCAMGAGIAVLLERAHQTEIAQKAACERSNDARAGLRREKDTEIKFLEHLPALFPEVSPDFFKDYISKQIANIEYNKTHNFAPVNCDNIGDLQGE